MAGHLPSSLEERLAYKLSMTGGKMTVPIIVADEEQRALALRFLAGKRRGHLIDVITQAEADARRLFTKSMAALDAARKFLKELPDG